MATDGAARRPVTQTSQFRSSWRRYSLLVVALTVLAGVSSAIVPETSWQAKPVAANHAGIKLPFAAGASWYISQGYNTSPKEGWSHYNCDTATAKDAISQSTTCSAGWQYKYSFDLRRSDGNTTGQPVLSPVNGTIRWIDNAYGGMSIDLGDGHAIAFFHANLASGLAGGQAVRVGQHLGTVAAAGAAGNGGTPHIHIGLWKTTDGGNWSRISVPFTDEQRLDGYDFPALSESTRNQHWNKTVVSTNGQATPVAPPSVPVLRSPATGTSFTTAGAKPTLAWNAVSGATDYQIVINDGQQTSPWMTATSWTIGPLADGQYAWQVRARNGSGTSALSPKWIVWIDAPDSTPAPPTTSPPSGALGATASPTSGGRR